MAKLILTDHRPWGYFTVLEESVGYKVKLIVVNPHAKLSLQSHQHRAENWVVVEGVAIVQVDDIQYDLNVGESIFIPERAKHRLINASAQPVKIIETQTGTYLGEDDIERFEDDYGR